jgi:hypothetical protein
MARKPAGQDPGTRQYRLVEDSHTNALLAPGIQSFLPAKCPKIATGTVAFVSSFWLLCMSSEHFALLAFTTKQPPTSSMDHGDGKRRPLMRSHNDTIK